MDVTVAICTWNRAELLRQTLEQFTNITSPSGQTWELLVANNNCTDATDDVLVDRDWIVEFLNTAKRFPEAAVVGGYIEPWFPASSDPAVLAAFPIAAKGFCGLDHGSEE